MRAEAPLDDTPEVQLVTDTFADKDAVERVDVADTAHDEHALVPQQKVLDSIVE